MSAFEKSKTDNLLTVIGRISQPCHRDSIYEDAKALIAEGFCRDVALSRAMVGRGYGSLVRLATDRLVSFPTA